ncbi:MAG: HDIG domain-containing protein [Desulfovibrionaceae bacterium]|nr:HDIG domain-containing protein [Desulfovibrionaceae bacterium]
MMFAQHPRDRKDRSPERAQALSFAPVLFPKAASPDFTLWEGPGIKIPSLEECAALWDKYAMPPHIRDHSNQVARIVETLGELLQARGAGLNRALLLAGGLLHDIAKAYTISFGGNHAQLGAAWMVREELHPKVGQMILHHVYWPWDLDLDNENMLPVLLLVYADKRVRHDRVVSLQERAEDLLRRYGHTEAIRLSVNASMAQGQTLENLLSERTGVPLYEYTFDRRRLV